MYDSFPYSYADYFAFLGAVGLLLASTNALSLRQLVKAGKQWNWLMASTLLAAGAMITQVAAVDLGANHLIIMTQGGLLVLASLAAIGFCLADREDSRSWAGIEYLSPVLLAAGVWATIVIGMLALGLPLGRWVLAGSVSFAFLLMARRLVQEDGTAHSHPGYRIAAIGTGIWALAEAGTQLVLGTGAQAQFMPGLLILGSIGAAFWAGGLGRCISRITTAWTRDDVGGVRARVRGLLIALLVAGLLSGFVLSEVLGGFGANHVIDELEQRAHSTAAAVDAEHVARHRGTSADRLIPEHESLQRVLDATLLANPDLSHLNIMRSVSGRAVFLAQAARPGEIPLPSGAVYAEASPELLDALLTGRPLVEGPATDRHGTWYSTIQPIVDSATGAVVGHLRMDLTEEAVIAKRLEYRLAGLALSLAVAALIIGFYVVVQMTRASASVLSSSESRFRGLFEHAPNAIMVASVEDWILLAVNPLAAEWLAAPAQDIVGQPLKRFAHCQRNCECDHCVLDSDSILAKGSVLRALDGTERNVEFSTLETEYDGAPALVIFAHDISLRSKVEQAMTAHAEFNSLVTDISRRFVDATPETVDTEIESALARIGAYSDVDRVYVFKFSDYQHMTNTHEWVGDGVPSRREVFQESVIAGYPFLASRILGKREVYLPDVASDPELGAEERLALQTAGIRSMLVVPISIFGTVVGMLGFDSVRGQKDWSAESIALLRMVADII
ncbi:MAG: GAF domain-containing protein, partial [Actinobacteria bacterium]|nr:GAF domain-containing protein [Actinomycetota bacterium]